nr:hypothetical protein CFP56_44920 [Quercus suber]
MPAKISSKPQGKCSSTKCSSTSSYPDPRRVVKHRLDQCSASLSRVCIQETTDLQGSVRTRPKAVNTPTLPPSPSSICHTDPSLITSLARSKLRQTREGLLPSSASMKEHVGK